MRVREAKLKSHGEQRQDHGGHWAVLNKHLQETTRQGVQGFLKASQTNQVGQAFTQYTRARHPNGAVMGRFLNKLVGNRTKHRGFTKGRQPTPNKTQAPNAYPWPHRLREITRSCQAPSQHRRGLCRYGVWLDCRTLQDSTAGSV